MSEKTLTPQEQINSEVTATANRILSGSIRVVYDDEVPDAEKPKLRDDMMQEFSKIFAMHHRANEQNRNTDLYIIADLKTTDEKGRTALHALATICAPVEFGQYIKAGLDVKAKDSDGNTPLHMLDADFVKRHPAEAKQLVRIAVENGADLDTPNKDGKSARQHLESFKSDLQNVAPTGHNMPTGTGVSLEAPVQGKQ